MGDKIIPIEGVNQDSKRQIDNQEKEALPDDGLGGELGFGLGVVGGEIVDDGHGGGGFGAVEVGLGEERIVGVEEPGLGLRVVGGGGGGGGAGGVEGEG